jgi:hypothetical protein
MKQILMLLFIFVFVFCAPAKARCPDRPCRDGIKDITHCPDKGCGPPDPNHPRDPELNKRKNIWSDHQRAVLRSIQWIKNLPHRPTNFTECGSRDGLKQLGEGQKITVVAWALTARPGNPESANCMLGDPANTDNHIVLVDPKVKQPTLAKDERYSVTAEFTPRVRRHGHRNFTRDELNPLIDPRWKKGSKKNPVGKRLVRVTGLLMFDSSHLFHGPLKRYTNWEIHPVLKMEYCPKGRTCRADSDANWRNLGE